MGAGGGDWLGQKGRVHPSSRLVALNTLLGGWSWTGVAWRLQGLLIPKVLQ